MLKVSTKPEFQILHPKATKNKGFKPYAPSSLNAFIWASLERDNYRIAERLTDDSSHIDDAVFQQCSSFVEEVDHSRLRTCPLYHPLAILLSAISLQTGSSLDKAPSDPSYLLFLPWSNSSSSCSYDNRRTEPSIIAVQATQDEVEAYVSRGAVPLRVRVPDNIDWQDICSFAHIDSRHSCRDLADGKLVVQILSHYWNASRYQSGTGSFCGLMAHPDGYRIAEFFLDHAEVSVFHGWGETKPLVRFVYQLYSVSLTRPGLDVPIFKPHSLASINCWPVGDGHIQQSGADGNLFVDESSKSAYTLFDLFRGQGWGRKAYVGLGIRLFSPIGPPAAVFKHQWGDGRKPVFEDRYLRKVVGCPGVVRICEALSPESPLTTWTPTDEGRGIPRQSRLIALSTIGESLSACRSILEFLKVIYDLIEVHRILIEERGILHRDLSWGNVLINYSHLEGPKDKMDGHGFIDNILGDSERRIHAALADFDNAIDLEEVVNYVSNVSEAKFDENDSCDHKRSLRENYKALENAMERQDVHNQVKYEIEGKVGTPAYIAEHLARKGVPTPNFSALTDDDAALFVELCSEEISSANATTDARRDNLQNFVSSVTKAPNLRNPPKAVIHRPVHDAESIYWLMIFFLVRAWPSSLPLYSVSSGQEERSTIFDALIGNKIDGGGARTAIIQSYTEAHWRQLLPAPVNRLSGMLYMLGRYFNLTWHHVDVGDYELHGHDFMQLAVLREIRSLIREEKLDPTSFSIPLLERPLPVYSSFPIANFSVHLGCSQSILYEKPTVEKLDGIGVARSRSPPQDYEHYDKGVFSPGTNNFDLSPISDSFPSTASTITHSVDGSPASSRRSSTATLADQIINHDVLEDRALRILRAKRLEKQWFTGGPAPPLAPGYNH